MCSVYDNKVSLKVGGKIVALGDLVIINDRFGVKIEKVNDTTSSPSNPASEENSIEETENGNNQTEDFDYSDFEVENPE